jgi:SH3 domain-containing YSC84-like protein 1
MTTMNRSALIARRPLVAGAAFAALLGPGAARAKDSDEARRIVERARLAFASVVEHKEFDALRAGLKSARGVLVFPSILKGGFVVGGAGGTGVLLVRGDNGQWRGPAFYTLGALSVGLLAGGQQAEVVILVNTASGVDRLLSNSLKLGGDASIAAGPVGAGKAANLNADFVSYAKSKGAYAGVSVDGSVLDVRASLNRAYYDAEATPVDILVRGKSSNKHADALRSAVAAAAR